MHFQKERVKPEVEDSPPPIVKHYPYVPTDRYWRGQAKLSIMVRPSDAFVDL